MPSVHDLPVEVLLDHLLPLLPIRDLLLLGSTNRFFALICADDTFWKRRCERDFNFSGNETAQRNGWKALYQGLSRPRVFVWGTRGNGRLGLQSLPEVRGPGIPFPIEVKIPGVRIVSLTAGGMSFHALDSQGSVYVWGTLDGQNMALNSEGFSIPQKCAQVPHRLILPEPVRSISCGRIHTMILDARLQVWTFLSWGRPFRFQSALLDCHTPDTTPSQIESGWAFSSILTTSGDVLVYWPYSGTLKQVLDTKSEELDAAGDKQAYATSDHTIPCVISTIEAEPFRLPAIPVLPVLPDTGLSQEQLNEETKLVKIAAYDNIIIGLTNKGHVLKFSGLTNEEDYLRSRWEYLPSYSEAGLVCQHPTFAGENPRCKPPRAMHITHVSAHFRTFVAYSTGSSSTILMGDTETSANSPPEIMPALQDRSIISVMLGDYHFGALTSTGQLLTWGSYSHGALGLGIPTDLPLGAPGGYQTPQDVETARTRRWLLEPPKVEEPAEVDFNLGRKKAGKKFCFAASAAGWHTGALVIGLDPDNEEEPSEAERNAADQRMPGGFPSGPGPSTSELPQDPHGLPLLPGRMMGEPFRIGFAGRGLALRGRLGRGGLGRGGGAPPPPAAGNVG